MQYEAVIGLEVHVQLKTRSKMFCGCRNEYGAAVNTHVCPVCLGYPGALPVPNAEAIELTILTGLMLNCRIAELCKFDRKNYFYPDMPKNYQISQYDMPLCQGGYVTLGKYAFPKETQKDPIASANKQIRLIRIHLEEDVAKSQHFETTSGIDFNRAGTPLMEIVTEADIRSPEEAFAFLTTLKQILIYGGVSDADMEKGQLRCDVNVSVRPVGQEKFGTKCEVKNMNSISGVRRALAYEIQRQIEIVSSGGTIRQETRRWDDPSGTTILMRTKEEAHDYRYFPDPDLLPVRTTNGLLDRARARLPELPHQKKERFMRDYGLTDYQADVLAADKAFADYFEQAAKPAKNKSAVANYLINDFLATEPDLSAITLPPTHFAELADLVESGQINVKQAKEVLADMFASGEKPAAIVAKKGLVQISNLGELEKICDEAIAANPKSVADYKSGKTAAINALKGFVMKATKGRANPSVVDEILARKLT
jgi:aspartyl-tRNA(Asn)/glutamyl-tRNA(Gln) amidotransferase subunit B